MKVLNTEQIIYYQQKTFHGAKSWLLLISPFIQLTDTYFAELQRADKIGIKIIVICGKKALQENQLEKLNLLNNLEIFFCHNLHAKCILNEDFAVLSSMNLYEASATNMELGCLISAKYDKPQFDDLKLYCNDIIKSSEIYRIDICKKNIR